MFSSFCLIHFMLNIVSCHCYLATSEVLAWPKYLLYWLGLLYFGLSATLRKRLPSLESWSLSLGLYIMVYWFDGLPLVIVTPLSTRLFRMAEYVFLFQYNRILYHIVGNSCYRVDWYILLSREWGRCLQVILTFRNVESDLFLILFLYWY